MAINDLTDSIMDYLADLIEKGRSDIDMALSAKGYDLKVTRIWKDNQKVVDLFPSINIVDLQLVIPPPFVKMVVRKAFILTPDNGEL